MEACNTLREYAWLVDHVREYGSSMELFKEDGQKEGRIEGREKDPTI